MSLTVPQLAAQLGANQERALQLGNRLYDGLGQSLAGHAATQNEMRARMEGQVTSSLAGLNDRAGKLGAKLVKQLNQKQGQAYTYAFPLGITYPTNDALVHGLATNDMFPAMGLATTPVTDTPGVSLVGGAGNDRPVGGLGLPVGGSTGGALLGPGPTIGPPPVATTLPQPIPPAPVFGGGAPPPVFPPGPVVPPVLNPPVPPPVPPVFGPGGTGPAGGGGGGDTLPGGGGGAPVGPCPPGFVPNPDAAPVQSYPVMEYGWSPPYQPMFWGQSAGIRYGQPQSVAPNAVPADGEQIVCVDGSHLFPPVAGQIAFNIPAGSSLYVNSTTRQVQWATGPVNSFWVPLATTACDPTRPGIDPAHPPPPATGPACIPAPPAGPPAGCPPDGGGGGGGAGGGGGPPPPVACGPALNPPPPPPAGPPGGQLPPGQDTCATFDRYLQAIQAAEVQVANWIGMAIPQTEPGTIGGAIIGALTGGAVPILPWIVQRFASWAQQIMTRLAQGVSCDPVALTPVLVYLGTLRLLQKYTGLVPEQLLGNLDQLSNYVCQYLLPKGGEANAAWLAGQIPDATWECWVKAAGLQVPEWQQVRDAERHKPSVTEARKLYFRNLIDQKTYTKLNRQQGVTDPTEQSYQELAWRPWPAEHEVIAWAGEQLFDADTVTRFNLDDGFDDLYTGQFKTWWEASGRNQDMARKDWQAHWKRPGEGQLIEMVRRLRPDKVDPAVAFTPDDLDAALKQQGYNDFWVQRVKAISHRVAQRRDVQRLYQYHQIDEDGMKELLQDQGYDQDFSDQLVESWKAQRKQTESRYNGAPQAGALVRDYANGLMARSELETQVEQIVYYDGQDQEILDNADLARTLTERKLAVSGLKGLFTKGLVKIEDAQAQLAQMGMDHDAISELTQYWARLVKSKPKQVPAATLCTWRTDGLISASDQFTALTQLGYKGSDATFIVEDCTIKIAKAQEAAQQKALKAAQAAAQKAEAAATKAAANAKRRVKIVTVPSQNGTAVPAAGP